MKSHTLTPLAGLSIISFVFSGFGLMIFMFYPNIERTGQGISDSLSFELPSVSLPKLEELDLQNILAKEELKTLEDPVIETIEPVTSDSDLLARRIFVSHELGEDPSSLVAEFLSLYPEDPVANKVKLVAADIMYDKGDWRRSQEYLRDILSQDEQSGQVFVDASLLLGRIALERREYDASVQSYLERALAMTSEGNQRSRLAFYLGEINLEQNRYDQASRYYNLVSGEEGVLGRAKLYSAQKKIPETINTYAEFLDQFPNSEYVSYITQRFLSDGMSHAKDLAEKGYIDSALNSFWELAKRFPKEREGNEALLEIANLDEASSDGVLQRIIEGDNDALKDEALFILGQRAFEKDDLRGSLAYFDKLLEDHPNSRRAKLATDWRNLLTETLRF